MEGDNKNIVSVGQKSRNAYDTPTVIIELNGKYYVSLGVLEYDPNASDLTPEQKQGMEEIRRELANGEKVNAVVVYEQRASIAFAQTDPPTGPWG